MPIATVNPATGQTVRTFEPISKSEIDSKLELAQRAFEEHCKTDFATRAKGMRRIAETLEKEKSELAKLATLEMGKPIRQAVAEVEKCAWACRHYADHAAELLKDERVTTDAAESLIRYQPLGIVLAIMPWNFPFWQVLRFAAPAVMAGNVGVLKHASNVPQCALAIESLFERSGLTRGVFQTLLIGSDAVVELIKDPRIKAVTLTGSESAGKAVAAEAGNVVKKTVLELGGSDPFIVMPSADLDQAATIATQARMQNNGESCIAAKRFIVAESIADEFQKRLVQRFEALRIGDPMDDKTELGPVVNESGLNGLEEQVRNLTSQGGKVVTGGKRLDRAGYYFAPTIVADTRPDAPAAQEEIFGPVAMLFRVKDAEQAIALANSTSFGLGASVWTKDAAEREKFINGIDAGAVFVNGMVKSDPRLPFGGVKHSGYGRELGVPGIREFVNVKTVWIGPAREAFVPSE